MTVAFIPVRGGSKSIPLKNIKNICSKPLVYWVVKAASLCKNIDMVYVATDSDKIRQTVADFGFSNVMVIDRSAENACDTATTESAMLEFAQNYDFDNIVLIQATSPMLTSRDLENGFNLFANKNTDSVISVVRQKRFNWQTGKDGFASPTNYDVYNRPRRQDFDGYLVENGAFYITTKSGLLNSKNRVWGNIAACEMCQDSFFEIDEPSDFLIIEALMKKNGYDKEVCPKNIQLFLTDCDGCLTDAGMYYSEKGDELKKFNTKDGAGFGLLREKGIKTGIITGEDVELNRRRAKKLHLDVIKSGISDKGTEFEKVCSSFGIDMQNALFIGDDIIDIPAMQKAGFSACPADAVDSVKAVASYIAKSKGGEGVIREVADLVINNYD